MRILLVCPVFPPDKGVATLRASFFYTQLVNEGYDVTVMKCGTAFDFKSPIKTFDSTYINSLPKVFINRNVFENKLKQHIAQYDVVWVSVPMYPLLEIARIARALNKKVIVDVRDLPDLIPVEKTKRLPLLKPLWWLNYQILRKYIITRVRDSDMLLAVGHTSTSILQQYLPRHPHIYNVHNGYTDEDAQLVAQLRSTEVVKTTTGITIALSGSIHAFRDTPELRSLLILLDSIAATGKELTLKHYGTLCPALAAYMAQFKNLNYQAIGFADRAEYLQQLIKADYQLLVCSAELVWEPTTTVFDYILTRKPVIFVGMRNNEAYNILDNAGIEIIAADELIAYIEEKSPRKTESADAGLAIYNRLFQINKIKQQLQRYAQLY